MGTPCGQSHAKTDWDHTIILKKEGGADVPKTASVVAQPRYTERQSCISMIVETPAFIFLKGFQKVSNLSRP